MFQTTNQKLILFWWFPYLNNVGIALSKTTHQIDGWNPTHVWWLEAWFIIAIPTLSVVSSPIMFQTLMFLLDQSHLGLWSPVPISAFLPGYARPHERTWIKERHAETTSDDPFLNDAMVLLCLTSVCPSSTGGGDFKSSVTSKDTLKDQTTSSPFSKIICLAFVSSINSPWGITCKRLVLPP